MSFRQNTPGSRRRIGLFARLLLPLVFLIAIAGSARSWMVLQEEAHEAQRRAAESTDTLADTYGPLLAALSAKGQTEDIHQALTSLSKQDWLATVRWQSADATQPPIFTAKDAATETPGVQGIPGIHGVERSSSHAYRGQAAGTLTIQTNPAPFVAQAWRRTLDQIRMVAAVIVALFLVAFLTTRSSLRALRALDNAAGRLPDDLDLRVPVVGPAEIRDLGTTFNLMADRLAIAMRDLQQEHKQLLVEKERLRVMLMSIGDGVIVTDAAGKVSMLNPVAERMTGWTFGQASGHPIDEVFHIVNEDTRLPVESPALRAITAGVVVGMANHTVLISRSGDECSIEDSAAPIRGPDAAISGAIMVFHDVSDRKRLMRRMDWQATHDTLTGLPNRSLLMDRLNQAMAQADRSSHLVAVCFLDIDHFKTINDTHGHDVGDHLLQEISQRMRDVLRSVDTIARLGGDEFVLLLCGLSEREEAKGTLARVLACFDDPLPISDNQQLRTSPSIGVAWYEPQSRIGADVLLRHADVAMYQAKQAGRNGIREYDAASETAIHQRHLLVQRVAQAINDGELRLHFQPQVNMRTGTIVGFEALVRWQHPERGLLPPVEFIPLIEDTDHIILMGQWVMRETLAQLARWKAAGQVWPVSINLSARCLMEDGLMDSLRTMQPDFGLLEFEIVETAAIHDVGHVARLLKQLRTLGTSTALDDFGTGYASLSYLQHLHTDKIKIDKSFIIDVLDDADDFSLVTGMVSISNALGRQVVAEGIETVEHGLVLMRMGCDIAQGYAIAPAMPGDAVADWAQRYSPPAMWSDWAHSTWELDDFPMMVGQYDHLRWVRKVLGLLDGQRLDMPPEQLSSHKHCRFGQWYHGAGFKRYGNTPEFTAIDDIHRQVHETGIHLAALVEQGDVIAARREGERLQSLKDALLAQLAELQHAAARHIG